MCIRDSFQDVAQLCQGVLVLDVLYQGGDKAKDRLFIERGAVFELQDGVFIGSQCRLSLIHISLAKLGDILEKRKLQLG